MKRKQIVLAAGLVACVGVGIGVYLSRSRPPEPPPDHYPRQAPPVRMPAIEEWDVGTTSPGKVLTRAFAIENTSGRTWTVKNVLVRCACGEAKLRAKTIPPGETGWVDVTYKAPRYAGRVGGTVLVEFAEPDSRVFQLTLKAEVRGLLTAQPGSLEFDHAATGPAAARTVKLSASGEPRVRITRVEAPAGVRADLRPGAATGQEWTLVVYPESGKAAAAGASPELVVHTAPDEVGLVRIPLTFRPAVRLLPDRIAFGAVAVGSAQTKKVILEAAESAGTLTNKDVVVEHDLGDLVEIQADPAPAGKTIVLTVTLRPRRPGGKVEALLRVALRGRPGPPALLRLTADTGRTR